MNKHVALTDTNRVTLKIKKPLSPNFDLEKEKNFRHGESQFLEKKIAKKFAESRIVMQCSAPGVDVTNKLWSRVTSLTSMYGGRI